MKTNLKPGPMPICLTLIVTIVVLAVAGCTDSPQGQQDQLHVTGETQSGHPAAGTPVTTRTITALSPQKILPQAMVPQSIAAAVPTRISDPSERAVPNGILIDGIHDIIAGDPLVVSGRTSLPVGTDLAIKVVPVTMDKGKIAGDFRNVEKNAVTKVVEGSENGNRYSVTFDTGNLLPADHIASVSPLEGQAVDGTWPSGVNGSYVFAVIAR
jgi:hypothetical protein